MRHVSNLCAGAAPAPGYAQVDDVLIVDDHPLICHALSMTLTLAFGLRRVRTASSLKSAQKRLGEAPLTQSIVLDLNLPDVAGVEGVMTLHRLYPQVPLTVISAEFDAGTVAAVMAAGARGYVCKSLPREQMVDAFKRMWSGELVIPEGCNGEGAHDAPGDELRDIARRFATLTPQQMNILRLICQGCPNKLISYELSIAEATVKTHIAAIMNKINVSNRTQAALLANRAKIFTR